MPQAGADLFGTENRALLDRPLKELEEMCQEPCRNPRCKARKEFQGVTDNARVKCTLRFHRNTKDLSEEKTAVRFAKWPAQVSADVREKCCDFPNTWSDCSPRFVFHVNEALKKHLPQEDPLTINIVCEECETKLANPSVEHTVESLYTELRKHLVHDPSLPLWYIPAGNDEDPAGANEDLPDDARAVCELSHRPGMNAFADKILPDCVKAITASLDRGSLHKRLQEKRADAQVKFGGPSKSYLRIGLGVKALGRFTAVLELWPLGHQSPKHAHGGCAGSVRVVYGALLCNLYRSLKDEEPMPNMRNLRMEAGKTTWLNRQHWFVHEVCCDPEAGLPFAMSVHLYKSCTDAFAFVRPEARESGEAKFRKIEKGNPSNDYFWNLGLPDHDPRVKEVREGKVKDFADVLTEGKALAERTAEGYPGAVLPPAAQAAASSSRSEAAGSSCPSESNVQRLARRLQDCFYYHFSPCFQLSSAHVRCDQANPQENEDIPHVETEEEKKKRKEAQWQLQAALRGGDAAKTREALQRLRGAKTLWLNLDNAKLGPQGAQRVVEAIAQLRQLKELELRLSVNNLGDDGAKAVASELQKLTSLSKLKVNFGRNNLSDDGAKAVASELQKLANLTKLGVWLGDNNVSDDGAKAVASELVKLANLTWLTVALDCNDLGDDVKQSIRRQLTEALPAAEVEVYA